MRLSVLIRVLVVPLAVWIGLVALQWHSPFVHTRSLQLGLVFLLLASFATLLKTRAQNVCLTIASLTFGLAVVQGVIETRTKSTARAAVASGAGDMVAAKDGLGWGPRHPGSYRIVKTDPAGRVVFDMRATIDESNHRRTVPARGGRPVGFFGDSFVFGDGVNDEDTLPQAFADLGGGKVPALNLGFSGWAPSQSLANLQMEPYKSELPVMRRLILFTAAFHVERTACKGSFALGSGPRYVLEGQSVKYAGTCVGSTPRLLVSLRRTFRSLMSDASAALTSDRVDARDVETYIKIIETFVQTGRRDNHADTTVLMEPGGDDLLAGTGYTQDKIVNALRASGVDVLVKDTPEAGADPRYSILGDGHPTALAHRKTAMQIKAHLRKIAPDVLDTGNDNVPAGRKGQEKSALLAPQDQKQSQ